MAYHYMWAATAEPNSVMLNIGFVVFTSSTYYLRFISKTFCYYDGREYHGWLKIPLPPDNISGKYKVDSHLSLFLLYYAESWDN